ncbi:MAG: isoprenylcysteine carboxyl methyltransferase family protein [Actinomycetes bacterium]
MTSQQWFTLLVVAVSLERLVELGLARRNLRWSLAHGGHEVGRGHFRWMVLLHIGLLVGCLVEVWLLGSPWLPWLGWPMLGLVLLSQGLRWWCIATLGRQWNTRIVVVPGMARVNGGPYRWMSHPNYVAVVVEGFALPLVHTAWVTATIFTVLNAILLRTRVATENQALESLASMPVRP